jgi:hypothetical protein
LTKTGQDIRTATYHLAETLYGNDHPEPNPYDSPNYDEARPGWMFLNYTARDRTEWYVRAPYSCASYGLNCDEWPPQSSTQNKQPDAAYAGDKIQPHLRLMLPSPNQAQGRELVEQ